jgi:hypothetical protein
MEKRKTIEEYERLAAELAAQRDAKSEVAARLARENKVLRDELKPTLERLSQLLGGTTEGTTPLSYWSLDGAIRLLMEGRSFGEIKDAMFEQLGVPVPQVLEELYVEYTKMKLTLEEFEARATKQAGTRFRRSVAARVAKAKRSSKKKRRR